MTKFTTRGLALALLLGAAPVGIFVAHAAQHRGWGEMSTESIQRLQDGKLAGAKAALKLDDNQTKLWTPVEEQIRAMYKARLDMREDMKAKREQRRAERNERKENGNAGEQSKRGAPNFAERFEKMSQRLSERADRMKSFSTAFSPFYATLSEDQKAVLGPVIKQLKIGGNGMGRGKWARGGDDRGPGHGKGWHGRGRGGPDEMREGGPAETPPAPGPAPL